MSFIQLLIIQLFIFAGLVFFMYRILTRHATRTTGHLQELSQDYMRKQEELKKRIEAQERERQETIAKAQREAEQLKAKTLKEAQERKDKLLEQARLQSEQIVQQAEQTKELILQELDQKIEERALRRACELIQRALPEKFQRELHSLWMKESSKVEFQLESLNLPEDVKEVNLVAAFPLTQEERGNLKEKLKRLGGKFTLKEEVDSGLVAGFMITIGSVVIDGSLRHKIQEAAKSL